MSSLIITIIVAAVFFLLWPLWLPLLISFVMLVVSRDNPGMRKITGAILLQYVLAGIGAAAPLIWAALGAEPGSYDTAMSKVFLALACIAGAVVGWLLPFLLMTIMATLDAARHGGDHSLESSVMPGWVVEDYDAPSPPKALPSEQTPPKGSDPGRIRQKYDMAFFHAGTGRIEDALKLVEELRDDDSDLSRDLLLEIAKDPAFEKLRRHPRYEDVD